MATAKEPGNMFNIARVLEDLAEHGVAVVADVITTETCDGYVKELRAWLEKFDGGFPDNMQSIIHKYGIARHPVSWKVRHDVRPVFEELWGTEKLLTSMDGMAIGQPPELYDTQYHVPGKENFHHDQGPHRVGRHGYQGAVYLEEATDEDWCFEVLDGSHTHFEAFFQTFTSKSRWGGEFRKLGKKERKWFTESAGCKERRIAVPKGGMVIWDSRTVHSGAPPIFGRKTMNRWRFVSFVCMAPAAWAEKKDIEKKVQGYNKVQCSNHWPTCSIKFFKSGQATPQQVVALPPEARTVQAQQLVGAVPYDFDDGKPNGPPKPTIREVASSIPKKEAGEPKRKGARSAGNGQKKQKC